MRVLRMLRPALALVAGLAIVACSDDGPSGPGTIDVTISGSYKLESGKLTLSDDKNGNLEGTVTMQGPKAFLLKLTGAPADDPGIVFEKK